MDDPRMDNATPDTDESSTSLLEEEDGQFVTGLEGETTATPGGPARPEDVAVEKEDEGMMVDMHEPVVILGEVVAGNHLSHPQEQQQQEQPPCPSFSQLPSEPLQQQQPQQPPSAELSKQQVVDEDFCPFCVIKFGGNMIHQTKKCSEPGSNPIWTISDQAIFLLKATPHELAQQNLQVALWYKIKDPLKLTTLQTCLIGQADIPSSTLLNHCHEERLELNLYGPGQAADQGGKSRGTLTLRFRLAAPSDDVLLRLFDESLSLFQKSSSRSIPSTVAPPPLDLMQLCQQQQPSKFETLSKSSMESILGKPLSPMVTEADETQVAGESFVKSISAAFTSRSYFDRALGEKRVLVKPHPDPQRLSETSYLTASQLKKETMGPSHQWVEAGSGKLGKLYLEILACKDLPNVDVGEAVGNVTDCFVCAVFEDVMVQTPVIDDELSPHWLPWTQRAFCFGIMHPASMLYLATFDFDLGLKAHDPLGRVAVNLSNLQRDTDYTLEYNLYPSSNITDRTSSGSILIRLRIEFKDEKEALLAAFRPRPKFHINVTKEKSLAVVRYTCFGEYGEEKEQKFDLTVTRSYVNEMFYYKKVLGYCIGDAMRSLIFWRGQVQIFGVMLPIHSFLFYCAGVTLIERPYLTPSFLLLAIAWIMLANLTQRRQHPLPWNRAPSFWHYVEILRTGKSSISFAQIEQNEGWAEAQAYEKWWEERLEKDQKVADTKWELQQKINNIGNEDIQTKVSGGIPLDLLERLSRYQGMIGRYCGYFRLIKIILTWEESVISFWITASFLVGGLVSLLLPWSFILRWSARILVWGLFGPHMKLVDMVLHKGGDKDDKILQQIKENFKKESRTACVRRQEAVKLKDMKCLFFGKYITLVPSYNLSRHYDLPLPTSSARLHYRDQAAIQLAPHCIPGQQFYGGILPRTEPLAVRLEEELPALEQLHSRILSTVNSIQRKLAQRESEQEKSSLGHAGEDCVGQGNASGSAESKKHVTFRSYDTLEKARSETDFGKSRCVDDWPVSSERPVDEATKGQSTRSRLLGKSTRKAIEDDADALADRQRDMGVEIILSAVDERARHTKLAGWEDTKADKVVDNFVDVAPSGYIVYYNQKDKSE